VSHPLHLEIGEFLRGITLPDDCQLILAPECGGSHNLPLFCSHEKSNDTEYCNVDAMVVKDKKVGFLLEIEESGLTPTKICGKFLTSALSTHFIHDVLSNAATPIDNEATFVQVMDTKSLKLRTKKVKQGRSLERSIRDMLPVANRGISTYRLFFFRGVEGFRSDESEKSELREVYMKACGCPSQIDAPERRG
jgi:hypothetical protein